MFIEEAGLEYVSGLHTFTSRFKKILFLLMLFLVGHNGHVLVIMAISYSYYSILIDQISKQEQNLSLPDFDSLD